MTNVIFEAAVKHWRIPLLNVILVKYFALILILGGIVKITRKSNYYSVIFYLRLIKENSPFQASFTVCLWPEITFIYTCKK